MQPDGNLSPAAVGIARRTFCDYCEAIYSLPLQKYEAATPKIARRVLRTGVRSVAFMRSSLRPDCRLCNQLAHILSSLPNRGGGKSSTYDEYEIWSHFHHLRAKYANYLSIVQPGLGKISWFLPIPTLPEQLSRHACTDRLMEMDGFEISEAKIWLANCRLYHGTGCGPARANDFKPKRLIDCTEGRLCLGLDDPYVCLSYTWGTSGEDYDDRRLDLPAILPQTILDAIKVTLDIGLRYLWVDRYCIDQKDSEEVYHTVRNMDSIYHGASLTIIAAAGDDAHHGLVGISRTRGEPNNLQLNEESYVSMRDPKYEIESSRWSSRGWTYQEMLLSRRRLVFTETQVYYQCMKKHYLEGFKPQEEQAHCFVSGLRAFPEIGVGHEAMSVYSRVEEYYHRQLSYVSDNINALAGIFQVFSRPRSRFSATKATHFFGIPILFKDEDLTSPNSCLGLSFPLGLAWVLEGISKLHMPSRDHLDTKAGFPSWSWASAKACRPPSDISVLSFTFGAAKQNMIFRDKIEIYVTMRSSRRMGLAEYIKHGHDYTEFYPSVEIKSLAIQGHLESSARTKVFTSLPSATVRLHTDPQWPKGEITAMYVGVCSTATSSSNMTFILLESIDNNSYRHLGMCSAPLDPNSLWKWVKSKDKSTDDLVKDLPGTGQPWLLQTLKLV